MTSATPTPGTAPAARITAGKSAAAAPGLRTHAQREAASRWAVAHPRVVLLAAYAVSRVVALIALAVTAHNFQSPAGVGHPNPGLADMFRLWDSAWYEKVATEGYPIPLPVDPVSGKITFSQWAFFPLFPMLVRGLMVAGLSFTAAAVLLNLILGAIGALLVWRIFSFAAHASGQPARARLALVAACLWCFYPTTLVLLIPYTEALATVLIAAALLALMYKRYLWVGVIALACGLTRAVAPALALAVVVHLVIRWREERETQRHALRGDLPAVCFMVLATALSAVAWPLIVAWRTGLPKAFFDVQAAWGQRPSEGPFTLWLQWAWNAHGLFSVLVMVGLVATYVALVIGRHGRWLPVEVRAWAVAYPIYLFAVVRPITSMWRFLLLDFPIAALVASVAMRTSSGKAIVPHWRARVAAITILCIGGVFWWSIARFSLTPWAVWPP